MQVFTIRVVGSLLLATVMALVLGLGQTQAQAPDIPLDTAFTYQGFLVYQGSYYDGTCDFKFDIFNVKTKTCAERATER